MANLEEILWNEEEQLNDDELLRYLDAKTPAGEKQAIEEKLMHLSFEKDAIDGLRHIEDANRLQYIRQLNKKLQQQLQIKKRRKPKEILRWQWIVLAVLLLLFICIAGYMLIHLSTHPVSAV